jgi:hypothetical protein
MCTDPKCKWITIIEDDKTGEKCYTHYQFLEDGTFKELFSEGDLSLKIYSDVMKHGIYFNNPVQKYNEECIEEEPEKPEPEPEPYNISFYPGSPKQVYNYPCSIAMDCRGNFFDLTKLNTTIDLELDDVIDLSDIEDISDYDFQKDKNPCYKSSNGF